ncbi:hypothetical protein IJ674_06605 [bacterium]|nr:hypothetical protein [bacterium]
MFNLLICIVIAGILAALLMPAFKRCSEYEILVVSNKNDKLKPKKIVPPKGIAFVNPFTQEYAYIQLMDIMKFTIHDEIFPENDCDETFECSVGICPGEEYYNVLAENFAGLSKKEMAEIAENIIKKEILEISKEIDLAEYLKQKNSEEYFKRINEKLNRVGLELLEI